MHRITFAFVSFSVWIVGTLPITEATEQPNIVLIIADDMSWDDCGAYGHPHIRTPHIDSLARDGMKFEHALLTISSCSPSRSSIITGRYPHNTDADELHWPLPGEQTTFVELLKAAGYWTAAAGKWHLGSEVRDRFDLIRDADTSGFQLPSGKDAAKGTFVEKAIGDAKSGCVDWVRVLKERPRDVPFFLWLAALDPHRPYADQILDTPHQDQDVRLPPYHPDRPAVRKDYQQYYDEIGRLDRFVGDVLAELKSQNAIENTVIIFISDNGRPFPRDKTTLYDSGIRTPLLIHWPERIRPNSICKSLVSVVDLAPTIVELAGLQASPKFEGKSFVTLLDNPDRSIREFAFAEKNWHDFEDHARAVRSTRFKYIRNSYEDLPNTPPADAVRSPTYQTMLELRKTNMLTEVQQTCFSKPRPKEELYDTNIDPHELKNLAGDSRFANDLQRLRQALNNWEKQTGDHMPNMRTADEFDRETGKPTAARRRPRWSKKKMVAEGLAAP